MPQAPLNSLFDEDDINDVKALRDRLTDPEDRAMLDSIAQRLTDATFERQLGLPDELINDRAHRRGIR